MMGRAGKWLKSLFVFKKDGIDETPTPPAGICHNPATIPPNLSPNEAAWLRSYYIETEKEQSKHAIAVAAATAAAADAAILAAQAAVTVVKLTGNGRHKATIQSVTTAFKCYKERNAAVLIQSVFRGYLARKALRALKSLVKIQAVVRGFLVRKQAAAMLQGMQALVRAQAGVLSRRVRVSGEFVSKSSLKKLETRSVENRRLLSTALESRLNERAKIVDTRPKSRSRRNSLSIYESITNEYTNYCSTRLLPFDEYKYSSTAQSTPKHATKRSLEWTLQNRNYMANTQSFRAKLRSHSAPRQRSSEGEEDKKRMSLLEITERRNSMSKSSSEIFKSAVMRKIDGSRDILDDRWNGNCYKNVVGR